MMRRKAWSYLRFSSALQSRGDSIRRQVARTEEYCRSRGLILEESHRLRDEGRSAFHGKHLEKGSALGAFAKLVRDGHVPEGDVLVIEHLDRISRLQPVKAINFFTQLLMAGIEIVVMRPEVRSYTAKATASETQDAVLGLCGSHGESLRKSDLLKEQWVGRRERACGPRWPWLRPNSDASDWEVIPERVAVIRSMYDMLLQDKTPGDVAEVLNRQGVEYWGRVGGKWEPRQVWRTVRLPALLGMHQQRRVLRFDEVPEKKEGDTHRDMCRPRVGKPIRRYPEVVTQDEYDAVLFKLDRRRSYRDPPDRSGVSLFTGIMFDARDGFPMYLGDQMGRNKNPGHKNTRKKRKFFASSGAMRGKDGCVHRSFPVDVVERAMLTLCKELPPSAVHEVPTPDLKVAALSGKLAKANKKVADLEDQVMADNDCHLVPLFKRACQERDDLEAELEEARKETAAARGAPEALVEAQSLIERLDTLTAEAKAAKGTPGEKAAMDRLRDCRSGLRDNIAGVVKSIHLLVHGGRKGKRNRPAEMLVVFHNNTCRTIRMRTDGWCETDPGDAVPLTEAGPLNAARLGGEAAVEVSTLLTPRKKAPTSKKGK